MEARFSFKELYAVSLKATEPFTMSGRTYQSDEVIAHFSSIKIAQMGAMVAPREARGGYDNRAYVTWANIDEINLSFTEGVFSANKFSLMLNAEISPEAEPIILTEVETLVTDSNGVITLKRFPRGIPIITSSEGIQTSTKVGKRSYKIATPQTEVEAIYNFIIKGEKQRVRIGQRLFNGRVSLEGRTRIKEDKTGLVKTGILLIPKLELMSSLSIRLGDAQAVNPVSVFFDAKALPVGSNGERVIMDFLMLDKDID